MMKTTLVLMGVGVALAVVGCGGGGADCSTFSACGGVLVGTWKLDGICGQASSPLCPTAQITNNVTATGTATFDTANFTFSVTSMGTSTSVIPHACLAGISNCSQLSNPGANTTCTGDANVSCTCVATVNSTVTQNGTYTVNGSTLTTTINGGGSTSSNYCVSGGSLKVQPTALGGQFYALTKQ
jgi:hypothetical protein